MKKIILISFLVVAICQYLGKCSELHLYRSIWEYDSLMHFLGGIFAGSLGLYYAQIRGKNFLKCALLSTLLIGVAWELARYVNLQPLDSSVDIIMDVLGGLTLASFVIKKKAKKTALRPRWA